MVFDGQLDLTEKLKEYDCIVCPKCSYAIDTLELILYPCIQSVLCPNCLSEIDLISYFDEY